MSPVRDPTQRGTTGVAFEVERIGWPSPGRLEIVGRWFGVRGRRFIRPTLDVEVEGESRRMLAVLDHKPWAVADGEDWIAAFTWHGEPADLTGSELTVGPDITVELAPSGEKTQVDARRFAQRPRSETVEAELAAAREKAQRVARQLHTARADHAAELVRNAAEHEAELERVRADASAAEQEAGHRVAELRSELDAERERTTQLEAALRGGRDELAVARADVAAQREELERERGAIAEQASKATAEERAHLSAELEAARRESVTARGERDAAIRDRDRARQERQVLLSSVRTEGQKRRAEGAPTIPLHPAVVAPPSLASPEPAPQGQLPARIPALAALAVLVVILVLLVAWAM